MGLGRGPTPPDPMDMARAQTGQNLATAVGQQYLNMVNQVGPNGTLTYSQSGTVKIPNPTTGEMMEIPQFTATTELSPEQQRLADIGYQTQVGMGQLGQQTVDRLGGILGTNLNLGSLPGAGVVPEAQKFRALSLGEVPDAQQYQSEMMGHNAGPDLRTDYGPTNFANARRRVEDALMSRVRPELDRNRESLRTSLVNQGINEGSEAFDRAMSRADQQATDAQMQAVLAGGQEQSRLAGLERDRAGFSNQAMLQQFGADQALVAQRNQARGDNFGRAFQELGGRQSIINDQNTRAGQVFNQDMSRFNASNSARNQALQEALLQRNQPLNEIAALVGGSQVTMPQFGGTPTAGLSNVDVAGLQAQDYQNRLAQWQQRQQMLGGVFGGVGRILSGGFF